MPTLTYDTEANALYIYIREEDPVLQQYFEPDRVIIDIGESGNVCGIEILNPGDEPWKAEEILNRYSPSFDIEFAEWFLRLARQHRVWHDLSE